MIAPVYLDHYIQAEKCGLKLKVVFKLRYIYSENMGVVSLIGCLEYRESLKIKGS